MIRVDVSGKTENMRMPARVGDVGYDLVCDEYRAVRPLQTHYLRTGVSLGLPPGVWARIVGRSSTLRKRGLLVPESIIDSGYRGLLTIPVVNLGASVTIVEPGQRLAQILFHKAVEPMLFNVEALEETDRGEAGFGSTGT